MSSSPHDVVVYSGTPAGVIAAVTAARRGARVLLLEPYRHVGGLSTSGLNTSEVEHMLPESWGGIQQEFYVRLGRRYGLDGPLHRWESRVAEAAFLEMLDEAGVTVEYDRWIDTAEVDGNRIVALTTTDGSRYAGRCFIDCSYEGDLARRAGVTMTFGRESTQQYDEPLAGQRFVESLDEVQNSKGHGKGFDEVLPARTVDADGNLLPLFTPLSQITPGAADHRVMNYNFRVTVSTADDRVPFPQPDGYDPDDFANIADWLKGETGDWLGSVMGVMDHPSGKYVHFEGNFGGAIDRYPYPSGQYEAVDPGQDHSVPAGFIKPVKTHKWELNNKQAAVWSLGHFGAQFGWPDGSHEQRAAIWAEHKRHNLGLLYFLANDPAVPTPIREDTARYGLAADEYTDHDHWPYQLYVREARRMVGQYVMTQHDILTHRDKDDAVMQGSHWIDCHHVQRVAVDEGHFRNEGRMWQEVTEPYDIPYRCLLPRPEECANLLVPVAVSASHVAFCSIRLESVWMLLGQAAGEAATLALDADRATHDIEIPALQRRLAESGVPLRQATP